MNLADANLIAPMICLTIGGSVLLLVEAFVPRRDGEHLSILAAGFLLLAGLFANRTLSGADGAAFGGMLQSDAFSGFFGLIFVVTGLLTVSLGAVYQRRESQPAPEFYPLVLFTTVGMMVLASAMDLIALFVGLELMSVGLYVLAASQRHSAFSQEAGFKYLILGAFASAFLLYGIAMLYGTTATTHLGRMSELMSSGVIERTSLFWTGWGLLLVGLAFKIALVPFHFWTPDVYDGAPAPVTGFMAAGVKAAAFAFLLRVAWAATPLVADQMQSVLQVLAVLTMTFGNVVALAQSNLKRMLAYSAIAHAGYLLVGVLSITSGENDPATQGVLFYLSAYALMNLGAFAAITFVSRGDGERVQLAGFAGLSRRHPGVAAALAVCMLSLAGIPPTAGFWGKLYVFQAAIDAGHIGLAIIALLNSAIAIYYYLRVIVFMYMRDAGQEAYEGNDIQASTALAAAALLLLWIGLMPGSVYELARLGAAALARSF